MRRTRTVATMVAMVLAVAGLGACDPPPPRARFSVTHTGSAVDSTRGDGICFARSVGGCTLRAALDEANALGAADITVPAGNGYGTGAITITGDVSVTGAGIPYASGTYLSPASIVVAAGAMLRLSNVVAWGFNGPHITVAGRLSLQQVGLGGGGGILTVLAQGAALLSDSSVGYPSPSPDNGSAIEVAGSLTVVRSHLRAHRLKVAPSGSMVTVATIAEVGECIAPAPESRGHVWHQHASCVASPTDTLGAVQTDLEWWIDPTAASIAVRMPKAASPLVDSIPLGTAGCSTAAVDLLGNPRGGDGNGDGVPGCDVGAIERQPA